MLPCPGLHIVFISHQWIAKAEPDPHNLHFNVIISAIESLCERENVDPKTVLVWIECVAHLA